MSFRMYMMVQMYFKQSFTIYDFGIINFRSKPYIGDTASFKLGSFINNAYALSQSH